ncbi:MAG TPA: hypothetical protein VGL29_03385 [Blastocatellia bacterium]
MARREDFDPSVPLPPGLSLVAIRKAVDYLERQLAAIQSHYDHPGWYIVWRYLIDPTESIEPGKPVIIWRVDVIFLERTDWKYEKSSAGELGGGRTHTFGVKNAAMKLKGHSAYARKDVRIKDGKPVPINGE